MIKLRHVRKTYDDAQGDRAALRGVDLHIPEGAFCGVVGSSGSGKTTLLNLIGGLDRAYEGEVQVAGQDLKALGDSELSRFRNRTMGFVFQFHNLLAHLSCEENVLLPAHFAPGGRGSNGGADTQWPALRRRARWALERVGLPDVLSRRPSQLSGGEQQRVAIARALLFNPPLLLGDAPTGSLDRRSGERVVDLFEELHREGTTVVLITHEGWIAERMKRLVRVDDGKIVPENGAEAGAQDMAGDGVRGSES
jgi:ABC-type lipoprotein export system ATPase subunit